MPAENYKDILVSDVYPDPDRIREHNVAKGTMANLFSRIWFLDTQDVRQEDAAVCIDRLYVRTNGDWNPETFTKELCCQHGRTLYDSQWSWRQYMLIRFGASEEVMNTPWDAWKNTRTINFMWISRRLARHKHITNEEELYDQSLLHMRRRGLRVEAQMASFDTISNAEQAMLVASSHFIVANRGAAITWQCAAACGGVVEAALRLRGGGVKVAWRGAGAAPEATVKGCTHRTCICSRIRACLVLVQVLGCFHVAALVCVPVKRHLNYRSMHMQRR